MSSHTRHVQTKSVPSEDSLETRPKLRLREPLRRLKTIKDHDPPEKSPLELNKTLQPKFLRQKSGELSSTSPYVNASGFPFQRSKSFTRLRCRSRPRKVASTDKFTNSKLGALRLRTESLVTNKPRVLTQSLNLKRSKPSVVKFHSTEALNDTFLRKIDLSVNDSFDGSMSLMQSVDSPSRGRDNSLERKLGEVRERMTRELKQVQETAASDWRAEMRVYSRAMTDVITLGKVLGDVLETVKVRYEGWILSFAEKYAKEVAKSQAELTVVQSSLLREKEEKTALKRKFEKISKESLEMSKTCEIYQNKCFEYQEKLLEIASVSLDDYPPSESAWKLVLADLEAYKSWKENAVIEMKQWQGRERKLLDLLHAIKKRGFPVEEVYNTDVKKEKKVQSTPHSESSEEPICSGPALVRVRPSYVPALKIETVEVGSADSSSSSHFSTLHDSDNAFILDQSWSSKSRPTQETSGSNGPPEGKKAKAGVPDIPESWRRVLDSEHE